MRAVPATLSMLALLFASAACSTTREAADPPANGAGAPAHAVLEIGELEQATRGVEVRDLLRPAGSVARYEVVAGEAIGQRLVERMVADASAALVRIEEREGRVSERMEFRESPAGSFALERVDSIDDGSKSVFGSPLPFAAELAAGGELAGSSPMTVFTIPEGKRRAAGTARRALRVAGECDLAISGERMRAVALDLEFDVALDMASARVRARLFVVPGRGVVAEVREESRTILRLIRSTRAETIVLRSVEGSSAP